MSGQGPLEQAMVPAAQPLGEGFLEALLRILEKAQRREGRYYVRETIPLDGYVYERCHFDSCTLQSGTGEIDIRNCKITTCTLALVDRALRVVQLYNMGPNWGNAHPSMRAVLRDGLFTVTGQPGARQ